MSDPGGRHIAESLRPLAVPVTSLTADPRNARRHGAKNRAAVMASLRAFGQRIPLVVQREGMIVRAGNARLAAAIELGWETIAAVIVDEPSPQAISYAIADNRTAELASWDDETLAELLSALDETDKAPTGFAEGEIERLLRTLDGDARDGRGGAKPSNPTTAVGDVWTLGGHRLACGDATSPAAVIALFGAERPHLMVTDPPYGVGYDPTWRDGVGEREIVRTETVANDDRSDWTPAFALFPGDVAYVWSSGLYGCVTAAGLKACGLTIRAQICWVKQQIQISRGAYHWQHEPCWYAVREGSTARWAGDRKQSTVWEIENHNPWGSQSAETADSAHATQKPLECMARPIRNHGAEGDVVYDPFLGTGTTLIAAEQLKRRCFGMELDPAYCDVAVARWEDVTGEKAVLNGRP